MQREPRHLFTHDIPASILAGTGQNRPGIIPDGALRVAMRPPSTARHAPLPRQPDQERLHLFDTKTLYGGSQDYSSARATSGEGQAQAVEARAHRVPRDYREHARRLDMRCYQGGTRIRDRLHALGGCRGLVFGHYSEASRDVHELIGLVADQVAARHWRRMGARTQAEARGFYIQRFRRRLCLVVGREMARHRLRRIPFIGVPRATVRARMQLRDDYGPAQPRQFGMQVEEFHRYQAHGAILAARA